MNASDTNGMTPLLYAAMDNHNPDVINTLIDAGADDSSNRLGRTALILAAMMNNPAVVGALLDAGADVHAKDSDGKTALFYARDNDKLKGSESLLRLEKLYGEVVM